MVDDTMDAPPVLGAFRRPGWRAAGALFVVIVIENSLYQTWTISRLVILLTTIESTNEKMKITTPIAMP